DTLGQNGAGLAADGNGDQQVDTLDFDYWKQRFGNSGSGGNAPLHATVPEPPTLAFIVIAIVTGILFRVNATRTSWTATHRLLLARSTSARATSHKRLDEARLQRSSK